jgi:hypothetical protein
MEQMIQKRKNLKTKGGMKRVLQSQKNILA